MIKSIKSKVGFLKNSWRDWGTKRKIIVIESDDWGSIRVPSSQAQETLKSSGIAIEECPFLSFDHIETSSDFYAIGNTFDSVFNAIGKRPIITANYILANPSFDNIKNQSYTKYYREFFWDRLSAENSLIDYQKSFDILLDKKYILPQLHGLEHLQVPYWMSRLGENFTETKLAFDSQVYGISTNVSSEERDSYLASFNYRNEIEFTKYMEQSLKLALLEFEKYFGFKSKSFIAPNYVWSAKVEKVLADFDVSFIQSSRYQQLPVHYGQKFVKRYIGQTNQFRQTYLVRNVVFEPSTVSNKKQAAQNCIAQIRNAFMFNKPAIISIHRLNFMGGFVEQNRNDNLNLLKQILLKVAEDYPNLEFLSSPDLGQLIVNSK